jgi:RimJ/RimL family protein N-acetyltransferase
MNSYKILNKQIYTEGEYKLVPIRFDDRLDIMKWRNEQIYHLRQSKPLTIEDQNRYFNDIVSKLFDQGKPNQILFSFLKENVCVGYGGLVHINWVDKNAEISFLINTVLENAYFELFWTAYLRLIEEVAFDQLSLHKIYTYAFDLRPHLYVILEKRHFSKDARLKDHVFFDGKYIDVVIHCKLNNPYLLKPAELTDMSIAFKWANNSNVRKFSLTKDLIQWEQHKLWFEKCLIDEYCKYYFLYKDGIPVGSIRFDIDDSKKAKINYLIDPSYHGQKLGFYILSKGVNKLLNENKQITEIYGYVMKGNTPSIKIFEKLKFIPLDSKSDLIKFSKIISDENS